METIEKFELEIIFSNISYIVSNKPSKLSDNYHYYIEKSIEFFENLILSLDSLSIPKDNNEENSSYVVFPNLRKVVTTMNDSSKNINERDLIKIKRYFTTIISELQKLKDNPTKYYTNGKLDQLQALSNNLINIFSEDFKSHVFETEETFSNSYFLC